MYESAASDVYKRQVRVECLLDDAGGLGLFAIDGRDGERVGESYIEMSVGVGTMGLRVVRKTSLL